MEGSSTCPTCLVEGVEDANYGALSCPSCGEVLQQRTQLTADVHFDDSGLQRGRFVASDTANGDPTGVLPQASERAVFAAHKQISRIAGRLGLAQPVIESAKRIHALARRFSFLNGRRVALVCAACLYAACRQANLALMLVDFSDAVNQDVFVLGSVYVRLLRFVLLYKGSDTDEPLTEEMARRKSPLADPALYMQRFVSRLQLNSPELTQATAQLATRIVARMNRDWLVTGRKPSGVCGAAIVVATRQLGCRREVWEVCQVVRVCQDTIRSRIKEFLDTPSAGLTLEEFQQIDLEEEGLPPSLVRSMNKQDECVIPVVNDELTAEASKELLRFEREMERRKLELVRASEVTSPATVQNEEEEDEEEEEELSELSPEEAKKYIWSESVIKFREAKFQKLFPMYDSEHRRKNIEADRRAAKATERAERVAERVAAEPQRKKQKAQTKEPKSRVKKGKLPVGTALDVVEANKHLPVDRALLASIFD